MFSKPKRSSLAEVTRKEVSLTMHEIQSWEDLGYDLRASHFASGEIEGGHEATISGQADDFWLGGEEIKGKKLRMHVKVSSDLSRRDFEKGIIGGGQFYENYVDVALNLEPDQVRDVVYEMRISPKRQLFLSGFSISAKIFRATAFGLSAPRDS